MSSTKPNEIEFERPLAEFGELNRRAGIARTRSWVFAASRRISRTSSTSLVVSDDDDEPDLVAVCIQFLTTPVTRFEFGTMTVARSKVSISVERALIRRTKPLVRADTTQSTTRLPRSAAGNARRITTTCASALRRRPTRQAGVPRSGRRTGATSPSPRTRRCRSDKNAGC